MILKRNIRKRTSIQRKLYDYDPHPCVFHILLMSNGLAHCRSIGVVKIFEMIKQLSNVIFDIVIALRIGIHNFTHASVMDTAKIPFRHLRTFPYCAKSEIPRKCSYCTCRIFTVYGKMFYSWVCKSVTDVL